MIVHDARRAAAVALRAAAAEREGVSLRAAQPETAPITIRIPGDPVVQGRGRIVWPKGRTHPAIMDPAKSRNWKATAHQHYLDALTKCGLRPPAFVGAVSLYVLALFPLPTSEHRKRGGVPRRPHTKARGDASNVLKAVEDAGNGVLWLDDCQVARVTIEKWVAAQGEAPYVEVTVSSLLPPGAPPLAD